MKTNLQELRKAAGYGSARAFAEAVGISVNTYTGYEQDRIKLTLEKAWQLADALGCTLDELAGREWSPSEYSDPRQAELNKCWDECEEGDRTAILRVAKSFAAQEKSDGAPPGRGDPVPSQAIA